MNSNKIYGRKGDRVKVLNDLKDHGDVSIVEDLKGNRFAINVKTLNEQLIKMQEII